MGVPMTRVRLRDSQGASMSSSVRSFCAGRAGRTTSAALAALLAACGASSKSASPGAEPAPDTARTPGGPASNAQAVQVGLADVGLELASMDRSADACADFFQFACGGWVKAHPIPADK